MNDRSLEEKIRDALVIEEPDEGELADSLKDAVEIVDETWDINLKSGIYDREPKHQVFTYLLAKYAAARLSKGESSLAASRDELTALFDREVVNEVADHGWVKAWDSNIKIRSEFYEHTAAELAWRYTGDE